MSIKPLVSPRTAIRLSNYMSDLAFTDLANYFAEEDLTNLDEAGQPVLITEYTPVKCSFSDEVKTRIQEEEWEDIASIGIKLAEIRFHVPPVPHKGGKFELVKKVGIYLDVSEMYEVVAIKVRGEFGYVCLLKRIEL